MTAERGYATYAARLASFEVSVAVPLKKRSSNAKGSKPITWPHRSPSPEKLAQAGFYYQPTKDGPDNTVCYMCERQLDGWEEEDDPIVEHLKHSSNCGWAILMDMMNDTHELANMEDPTKQWLVDARTSTFELGWPHETKRGWICKTEKMVQAGWHFSPTPESDDFVSCAYCKLSLDGWEPKDNPFDEHYRRSPDCPFFSFAGTTAPKGGKGKKARTSKASRESNITVASEVPSIPDLNESIDTSTVSVFSTASTMPKSKNARGKGKAARRNKVQDAGALQQEQSVLMIEDEAEPVKPTRGKKRGSAQISRDGDEREDTVKPETPVKRRNTRTRNSVAQEVEHLTLQYQTQAMDVDTVPAKPVRGGRKRASTTTRSRKHSGASVASLRATAPDVAAIEAALEAELDKPLSDEELPSMPEEKPKRGRSRKATASKAPIRGKKTISQEPEVQKGEPVLGVIEVHEAEPEAEDKPLVKNSDKAKMTKTATQKRESNESSAIAATNIEMVVGSSMLTAQTLDDDSGHETDAGVVDEQRAAKGSKKKTTGKSKGKKRILTRNIEDIVPKAEQTKISVEAMEEPVEKADINTEIAVLNAEIEREEAAASKLPKKAAKGKKTKKAANRDVPLSMPGAFSPVEFREESVEPSFLSAVASDTPPIRTHATQKQVKEVTEEMQVLPARSPARTVTPRSVLPRATPASQLAAELEASVHSSPQSSDAENAPPSSRPEHVRPPLMELTGTRHIQLNRGTPTRVPLSPSKIGGGIRSEIPWSEVDVDLIFAPTPGGVESVLMGDLVGSGEETLNENEKQMTVQEWIYANAARAEEALRDEAERVVGLFEKEGARAMGVLEAVVCV